MQNSWQPLTFFSKKLSPAKQKYCAYDRELMVIYKAVRHIIEWPVRRPNLIADKGSQAHVHSSQKSKHSSSQRSEGSVSKQQAVISLSINAATCHPSTAVVVQPHNQPRRISKCRLGCVQYKAAAVEQLTPLQSWHLGKLFTTAQQSVPYMHGCSSTARTLKTKTAGPVYC